MGYNNNRSDKGTPIGNIKPTHYTRQTFNEDHIAKSITLETKATLSDEFTKNKKQIMSELRGIILNNSYIRKFMLTGDASDLELVGEDKVKSSRKWELLLRYSDVWDDDLKDLGYLEFKINYALTANR